MKTTIKAMSMEVAAALGYVPGVKVPRWKRLVNRALYRLVGKVFWVSMDRPGSQGEEHPVLPHGRDYSFRLNAHADSQKRIGQAKAIHLMDGLQAKMIADIERVIGQDAAESQAFWQKYDQDRCDDQEMADPSVVACPEIKMSGSNLPAGALSVEEHTLDASDGGPEALENMRSHTVSPEVLKATNEHIQMAQALAKSSLSGMSGTEDMISAATDVYLSGMTVVGVSGTCVPACAVFGHSDHQTQRRRATEQQND